MAKATRAQIARNGHIAALLREELAKRGWAVAELIKAMGATDPGGGSFVRGWVWGTTAPRGEYREKLAKLFGQPASAFAPRLRGDVARGGELVVTPGHAVSVVSRASGVRIGELLSVVFLADGTTRFRMDSVVPTDKAMPILRILMDAGVVTARGDDAAGGG